MDKTIVLTGGASGIGAATAHRLLHAGCTVHVLDVQPPTDPALPFIRCDLGDRAAIDAAMLQLPARIDALVQVAGIATAEPAATVIAVNFLGVRHLTESLLPRMVEGGSVVNVASSAARDWQSRTIEIDALLDTDGFDAGLDWLADHQNVWLANPYKFSKQCTAAYTYRAAGLARECGIRINCVNPGSTDTRLTPAFRTLVGANLYDWGVNQIGRPGTPEDIAPIIEFLAIGPCPWLNGVEILVDGGYVAGLVGGWIDPATAPAQVARPTVNRLPRPDSPPDDPPGSAQR